MCIVGVDIGANKTSFVLLKNLEVLKIQKISTLKTREEIVSVLKENIKKIAGRTGFSKISGVGIGVPGPVNKERDLIVEAPNLVCLKNCPLPELLEKDLKSYSHLEKVTVAIDNDANCFTLAEARKGAGKGGGIVCGVTLGSGIGAGLVIRGEIYRGAFGSAGEAGHMTIKFDGLRCSCGSFGCFEEYASQKFIKRKTKIPAEELAKLARNGNRAAQKIWYDFGKNLGVGLANIINILDPEIIVLGGGLSNAGELILKPAREEIKKRVLSSASKKYVKIKKAKFGEWAGAIGAALLLKHKDNF